MKNLWIATNNVGKALEFQEMFSDLGYQIKTLNDLEDFIEIKESGSTFKENPGLKQKLYQIC